MKATINTYSGPTDRLICLFGLWLLGCSTVVARAWLGSVYGDSLLVVCCPESNEPTPISL